MPNESYIYLADTEHAPYGEKCSEEILRYSTANVELLIKRGCKAVVIACNTATAVAAEELRKKFSVPIFGIEPAIKPAVEKGGNVLDAAISSDGKRIALLTVTPSGGGVTTSVMLAEPGKGSAIAENVIASSVGVQCHFTKSGKLAALTTTGVAYLSNNGELEFFYDFEGKIPVTADLSEDGVAICLKKTAISEKNMIIIFDKSGKIVYNDVVGQSILSLAYQEGVLFWTDYNGVSQLNLASQEIAFVTYAAEGKKLLAVNNKEILLCSPQKAVYITFRT
jgi:hypothetical protein